MHESFTTNRQKNPKICQSLPLMVDVRRNSFSSTYLGTKPNQEFLILILKLQIALLKVMNDFIIRVRNSGPKFSTLFMFSVRVMLKCDVTFLFVQCYAKSIT